MRVTNSSSIPTHTEQDWNVSRPVRKTNIQYDVDTTETNNQNANVRQTGRTIGCG